MARIEESINIKCPVDKVFKYTLDVKNWPKWQVRIREPEQTSQGQMDVGTTLRWTHHVMGFSLKETAKVTGYEPNKKWSKNIFIQSSVIEDHLIFEPIEGGTKFTLLYDIKFNGFLKLFSLPLVSSTHKAMKVALANIKSILGAGTTN